MPLIYSSEWVSFGGITPEEAAERALEMFNLYLNSGNDGECGDMTCCDDFNYQYRVNPDTGMIQQSSNGGATWQNASNTLQNVIVEPVPPVTSGVAGTKCDAATNVYGQIQAWKEQVSNDFTTAESLTGFATAVFEAILTAVLVILSAGVLTPIQALIIPLLGAALAAAWGAGKAAFDAYWTTEIDNQILCAAYCNIGDDGSYTDAQFSAFWHKLNADLPPSPAKMLLMGFLSSVGRQGLNAMAASGTSSSADCSSCECNPPSCVNEWHTSSPPEQYGTLTFNETDGTIDVVAGLNGSVYTVIMYTGDGLDNTKCCNMMTNEVISGSISGTYGWYPCGSDTFVTGIPGWESVYDIQIFSSTPFTIRFHPT